MLGRASIEAICILYRDTAHSYSHCNMQLWQALQQAQDKGNSGRHVAFTAEEILHHSSFTINSVIFLLPNFFFLCEGIKLLPPHLPWSNQGSAYTIFGFGELVALYVLALLLSRFQPVRLYRQLYHLHPPHLQTSQLHPCDSRVAWWSSGGVSVKALLV